LFVGVMLSFFSETGGYFSIVTAVLMGAAFFMLFGIVTYAMQRGNRDFTSTSQVVATNYDVVVSFEAANEARRLLHQLPMTQHEASASAGQAGYGPSDHQHEPYQPGTGHGSQQPGPQRPAAWNDPYGQRAPEPGGWQSGNQQPAGQPAEAAQRPAGTADTPPDKKETAKPSGFSYPDLPDGRPQYGVRVTDAPQQESRQDGPQQ
ncbi:MAG: ECF transporter S component, partial [Arthrobacter sp.]